MAAACLDAHDATGNIVYEMMAQELALHAMRALWSPEGSGFRDRMAGEGAEAIGRLADPLVPFAANCDAAAVLHRLALTTSKPGVRPHGGRAAGGDGAARDWQWSRCRALPAGAPGGAAPVIHFDLS